MATLETTFKEEQRFTQWWLWILLPLIFLSPFILRFGSIIENGFWGTFSKGIYGHIITIGSVIILFLVLKLKTKIDSDHIRIHYFPLVKKKFERAEIDKLEVISYTFWQVRGWGIRFWTSHGVVYNVKGNIGLSIRLKNGKKYLIGTQKPSEMNTIISTFKTQNTRNEH